MADESSILTAFMMGAPLEALSLVLRIDAEDALRRELRRIAEESQNERPETDNAAPKQKPTPKRKAAETSGQKYERTPQPHSSADHQQTFVDLVRTCLDSLGEATLDEICRDLENSGVRVVRDRVSQTLSYLKSAGVVERVGDGKIGRWRLVK